MHEYEIETAFEGYRMSVSRLRDTSKQIKRLPEIEFFLFGMGSRQKYIYRDGVLRHALTGKVIKSWSVVEHKILPSEYRVWIRAKEGIIGLWEDTAGIWLEEKGVCQLLEGGERLNLPNFEGHIYAAVLRVLHHEILVNIMDVGPVPNFFVYKKPWYRDSAMMAMVLAKTGNLSLISKWILGLREPYDRNNAGDEEADNLGQALFLVSLVGDKNHYLVSSVISELSRWKYGDGICGRSDFSEHPVYQTKWLKYGLKSLGLVDTYRVPTNLDSYSGLFWWDFRDQHVPGDRFAGLDYPYLNWAESHFFGENIGPVSSCVYPLSWESRASQADYLGLMEVLPEYVSEQLAAPHTWHAAEMFLSLLSLGETKKE